VPEELQLRSEELHIALRHLQNFEPPGWARETAASAFEAAAVVLPESTPSRALAFAVARGHLEFLAARGLREAQRRRCNAGRRAAGAQRLIQSLNPRPGAAFRALEAPLPSCPTSSSKKIKNVCGEPQPRRRPEAAHQPPCTPRSFRTTAAQSGGASSRIS